MLAKMQAYFYTFLKPIQRVKQEKVKMNPIKKGLSASYNRMKYRQLSYNINGNVTQQLSGINLAAKFRLKRCVSHSEKPVSLLNYWTQY